MVLFDALTEFLKKQALKGANEIIGYYSKKYKTVYHYGTGFLVGDRIKNQNASKNDLDLNTFTNVLSPSKQH